MKMPSPMRRWEDQLPPVGKNRMRKGMYILPSLFTAANIGAGYYALSQTVMGSAQEFWHFDHAALAIGVAVVADGLDGRIARMTNTTSDFGREFDSLADVITFGVAPAVLAWMWGFGLLPDRGFPAVHDKMVQLGLIATFIFLVAGASRLARFNIQVNPQPSNPGRPGRKYFVGLADSRRRRSGCRDHPSGKGISHPVAATGAAMVCFAHCRGLPDGEYLALLQF